MHYLERERNALQWDTFDLRNREGVHLLLLPPGVQLVTNAGLGTAGTTSTLTRSRSGDPLLGQPCQACVGIVMGLLDFATVDHVYDIVNRDRSLGEQM